MNICLFDEFEINKPLSVKDERAQHILKILHKKENDEFFAGIINKKSGTAKITKITEKEIFFTFEPSEADDPRPLFPLIMIIGFPRPIQLKRLLRDIAALGVCEVHLTGTELGEKSYMESNLSKKENVFEMLLDGTIQSGATKVPEIFIHKNLRECINIINERSLINRKFALDNKSPECSLNGALKKYITSEKAFADNEYVTAAIGSERGWTDNERKILSDSGYILCGMGNRIMRTETAATVSASIILNYIGALK